MRHVLFVSWDGPDSPYLETLFLPVFQGLASHELQFHVLHFTWGSDEYVRGLARAAVASGIGYRSFPILRGPAIPSALAMIAAGAIAVRAHAKRCRADVVMPRSIIPAAMVLAARAGAPWTMAFDADGLAADERVEFAGWSASGVTYRVWREIEAQAVRVANVVIARTEAAKPILVSRAGPGVNAEKIFVIPNARDAAFFSPGAEGDRAVTRAQWGVPETAPCLVFAGSIGPQYRPAQMLSFYARVLERRQDTRLVLLSRNVEELRATIERTPVPRDAVVIRSVSPSAMPRHLAAADLGLALRALTFSQRAVSPIKIGEYLLCGVPALATPVGDVAAQVEQGAGLVIDDSQDGELERAATWFVESVLPLRADFRVGAREIGCRHFGLETAVRSYAEALKRCTTTRSP